MVSTSSISFKSKELVGFPEVDQLGPPITPQSQSFFNAGRPDDTWAIDLDEADWQEDMQDFMMTFKGTDVPASLEISPSGNGTPGRFFSVEFKK